MRRYVLLFYLIYIAIICMSTTWHCCFAIQRLSLRYQRYGYKILLFPLDTVLDLWALPFSFRLLFSFSCWPMQCVSKRKAWYFIYFLYTLIPTFSCFFFSQECIMAQCVTIIIILNKGEEKSKKDGFRIKLRLSPFFAFKKKILCPVSIFSTLQRIYSELLT